MKRSFFFVFNILIMVAFLSSCAHSGRPAPVSDFEQPPSTIANYHIVARGETLYSIAWRYNLDFKSLAKVNGIGRSYSIYPGQKLLLGSVAAKQPWQKKSEKEAKKEVPLRNPSPNPRKQRSKKETIFEKKRTSRSVSGAPKTWVWPSTGKIINKFNGEGGLHKGIDLKGKLGEPVLAAADGTVVYAGSGLRGYGKLVIVKHSEKFLSAYAHNNRLMVTEGVTVRKGQQIAEMGSSGTDVVKLHFEIRFDGKPVDPIDYLPKKS